MGTKDEDTDENNHVSLQSTKTKMTKKIAPVTSVAGGAVDTPVPRKSNDAKGKSRSSSIDIIINTDNKNASTSTPAVGGGLWEYFVNRKREKTKELLQRHHAYNNNHAGVIIDSTERRLDDPATWPADSPTAITLAAAASSSSSSSIGDGELTSLSLLSPFLSSWINHAWQTVDSAKEWMLLHTTSYTSNDVVFGDLNYSDVYDDTVSKSGERSNENTIWATMTTLSFPTFLSSLNPFLDKTDHPPSTSTSLSSSSAKAIQHTSPSSAFPTFASRFEWATRQRNPYQAVIGRDVYYAENDWSNWLQLPHWLVTNQHFYYRRDDGNRMIGSRSSSESSSDKNCNNYHQFIEDDIIDGKGDVVAAAEKKQQSSRGGLMSRKQHSRTSDASLQAVRDLLTLVRQQVAAMELEAQKQQPEEAVVSQHQQWEHEQVSTSSSSLQSMTQTVSSSLHSASLLPATLTSNPPPTAALTSNPPPTAGLVPSSSLPSTTSPKDLQLLKNDSFDSEDNCQTTMRSSPVRTTPLLENDFFSAETNQSEHKELDKQQAFKAELASLLAEGTLRAYRDLALDEATELRSALHHWTIRWERPFLGWLEAGPEAWFQMGEEGKGEYSTSPPPPHLAAGKKVSQIQVILARRCAVIGELQQHLWRASWQKGVAGWGMLGGGVGGEWTSVVGEFGGIDGPPSNSRAASFLISSTQTQQQTPTQKQRLMKIFKHSKYIGSNVTNLPGGSRCIDDALTKWCIDAMRVIRDQLYRVLPTSQGAMELPYVEHWPREKSHFCGENADNDNNYDYLPCWAKYSSSMSSHDATEISSASLAVAEAARENLESSVVISDLGKMSDEVSAILECIEVLLEQQRTRRLDRLRPPSRLRRNWYLFAVGVPVGTYMIYKLTKEHGWLFLLNTLFSKTADICRDHVFEPLNSIYRELFTKSGRIDVTDRKARVDAIESLKRMIRSWLEESFPKMPVEEMIERAEKMDISLIEEKMEESIKHLYELNSVVRMSLIEMQFIKKELLNSLVQMDDLMGSNEINMRIAAMTPAVILLFAVRRGFQLIVYALFKMGKTKEEIYASFRQIVLDMERLLLMRDCPPSPPDPLDWGSTRPASNDGVGEEPFNIQKYHSQTLSAEDLGMLLLHIHECRQILWESRRRFRADELRNVQEDLAELAGERGPVNVAQQLQIISRMSRTYPFMKVISSGLPFPALRPGLG